MAIYSTIPCLVCTTNRWSLDDRYMSNVDSTMAVRTDLRRSGIGINAPALQKSFLENGSKALWKLEDRVVHTEPDGPPRVFETQEAIRRREQEISTAYAVPCTCGECVDQKVKHLLRFCGTCLGDVLAASGAVPIRNAGEKGYCWPT